MNEGNVEGGISKVNIKQYYENHRGVHASNNFNKDDMVLFIPKTKLITLDMALATPIAYSIKEKKLLAGENHLIATEMFMACALIQLKEMMKTDCDKLVKDLEPFLD